MIEAMEEAEEPTKKKPNKTTKPAPRQRRNYQAEHAELKRLIAKVLDRVDLADDEKLNLPPELKLTLYQMAIALLRSGQ